MPRLDLDILSEIVDRVDPKSKHAFLCSLSLVCRSVNNLVRAILFRNVRWPHPDQFISGTEPSLLFFPKSLWPCFRYFHLDWPDSWPDEPRWGTISSSVYTPKHIDKLEDALPRMLNIHTFHVTCPFDLCPIFLQKLTTCTNIKTLKFTDTPFHTILLEPSFKINLENLTLACVSEAVRSGEGPYDDRFQDIMYFMRRYRKQYLQAYELGPGDGPTACYSASQFFISLCRKDTLHSLHVSANYLKLMIPELGNTESMYPCLRLLTLTGAMPANSFDLSELVKKVPTLTDLRVLVYRTRFTNSIPESAQFSMATHSDSTKSPGAYAQLTSLAISNGHNMQGLLRYTTSLERLAICALAPPPRLPIALMRVEIDRLLADLQAGGGNQHLKRIRIISEENLDATFFMGLESICPNLEIVEVERCGYVMSEEDVNWAPYGDALSMYHHLRELRIAIPFRCCDFSKHGHPPITADSLGCALIPRRLCGTYLASRVPTLRRIGFAYRAYFASRRNEDRWLDFDVVRSNDGAEPTLFELWPTWYPYPEVWKPVVLKG